MNGRRLVVVSAVNFSEGGPLTVLRECLSAAVKNLPDTWDILVLAHKKELISLPRVTVMEFPGAKRSWFVRLYYEWVYFKKLSDKIRPDLWLSLHDISPRVSARRKMVYCHNPSPFYSLSWREIWLDPRFWIFNLFYKYLYRIFIDQNTLVIVQQEWIRQAFIDLFGKLPLVVAHPSVDASTVGSAAPSSGEFVFIYPALARVFKNFEVIGEAVRILNARGLVGYEVRITISGDENRYSKWLHRNFGALRGLSFIGLQSREQMEEQYRGAAAVLFPSKLETWGLPISEAKRFNKALLVADAPYARETLGTYAAAGFFAPMDAHALADQMQALIEHRWQPAGCCQGEPQQPYARDWRELWRLMTKDEH